MPYQRITLNVGGSKLRREELEGRMHLVVPAAILPPGVIEGSAGAVYYPDEENAKSANSWNHKPIVVYHPDKDGVPVSACDPVILNTRKIGILLKTRNKKKLLTECWLDEEKTRSVDNRILNALNKGEKIEVSTGLEFDEFGGEGEFDGKKYRTTARNYRPDHLAVLPDKTGAYSVADGGGMWAWNEQAAYQPESRQLVFRKMIQEALRPMGFSATNNELSMSDISSQLCELLAAKLGEPGKYWGGYVCEIYPDSKQVIYEDKGYQKWMISYTLDNDEVSLIGEPVAVERVTEYKTADGSYVGNSSGRLVLKEKETNPMAFDKKTHVNTLIGHGFDETDRVALEAMPDTALEKVKPIVATPPVPTPTPTVPANNTIPTPPVPQTMEQYIANAPPGVREVLQDGIMAANAEKDKIVKAILAVPTNVINEKDLRASPLPNLRAIYALVPQQPQDPYAPILGEQAQGLFLGAAGGAAVNIAGRVPTEGLSLPELNFDPVGVRKAS